MRKRCRTTQNLFKLKLSLFLLIAVIYFFFASGIPWIEADYQLDVARNLVENQSISKEGKQPHGYQFQRSNGIWYDSHGLTNVLLMLPIAGFEFAFKKTVDVTGVARGLNIGYIASFLGALTGVLINSLVCLVFFSILLLWERPLKTCLLTTLCLAFLTIIFPYSSNNYEGNLEMLFILSSLYFLFSFSRSKHLWRLVSSGSLAGLAVNTRDLSFIFLFCVTVFVVWLSRKKRNAKFLTYFFIGIAPFLFSWALYNWLRTGFFYLTPFAYRMLVGVVTYFSPTQSVWVGLRGLLLSSGASIFVYSPVLVFSIFGLRIFYRERKMECVLVSSIVTLMVFYIAKMPKWFGLWGWGPRYTLGITPLLMLPLGFWLTDDVLKNKIKKCIFLTVCAYSLLIQLSGTLTNWHARIGYLVDTYGENAIFYTVKYSQWWDSLRMLFVNLWNLVFGSFSYLKNPGYTLILPDDILFMSKTLFTWWSRLLFVGVHPMWVVLYVAVSFVVISHCVLYTINFIRESNLRKP